MKPSDRINEIHEELCKKLGHNSHSISAMPWMTAAILLYLDEQSINSNLVDSNELTSGAKSDAGKGFKE